MLIEIVRETAAEAADASEAAWLTRVVANRYPAVVPDAAVPSGAAPPHLTLPARGRQEVFVEGPRHDRDLTDAPASVARALIEDWKARFVVAGRAFPRARPLLFRNGGFRSGMSLRHPHSQLIVADVPAPAADTLESNQRWHYEAHGNCLLCELISRDEEAAERVVLAGDTLVTVVPWAASVPCEMRIVPRRHVPSFGGADDAEKAALAKALPDLLAALEIARPGIAYNLVIHSPPPATRDPALHWFIGIRPRDPAPAGYEIGSGNRINGSPPERDAARLREALRVRATARGADYSAS